MNQSGAGKITVTVDDLGNTGGGDASRTKTQEIDITINPVNDDPSVPDISDVNLNEEETHVFDLLSGVSDVETPEGVAVDSVSSDKGATLSIVDGKLTYTAAENFSGIETITYTISDGNSGETTETITVNVAPISDEPTLLADKHRFFVAMDNSAAVTIPLLG
ncbi:putative hemagglutinin/hemolysin-related protein [Vibrio ponticus]|nr:putative hemagglutinin/hemolysin-related protein [Vibrio ponticus]